MYVEEGLLWRPWWAWRGVKSIPSFSSSQAPWDEAKRLKGEGEGRGGGHLLGLLLAAKNP